MHGRAPSCQATITGLGGLPRGWAITVRRSRRDTGVLGVVVAVVVITYQKKEKPCQTSGHEAAHDIMHRSTLGLAGKDSPTSYHNIQAIKTRDRGPQVLY